MGLLLPNVIQKRYWSVGISFSFSLFIEIIQIITNRGCFDPDDVLLNTLGVAVSCGLHIILAYRKAVDITNNDRYYAD